jgi:hypothetical protein
VSPAACGVGQRNRALSPTRGEPRVRQPRVGDSAHRTVSLTWNCRAGNARLFPARLGVGPASVRRQAE